MPMNPRLLVPRANFDPAAAAYIRAVEIADAQPLETGVKRAINNFVIGCKADGIWSAIKASCILAGARTLSGALTPLAGGAPTNNGPFVSGDYSRKTGLVGNGSTKWINTNRASNLQAQDSIHLAVYATTVNSGTRYYLGDTLSGSSWSNFFVLNGTDIYPYCRETQGGGPLSGRHATGLMGINRSSASEFIFRGNGLQSTVARSSAAAPADNIVIFRGSATSGFFGNCRLAFYSVGDSLSLSLLDARVSALITAIGNAIP